MVEVILFVLAAGAAIVDFYLRRVWLAIAFALMAVALAISAAQGVLTHAP